MREPPGPWLLCAPVGGFYRLNPPPDLRAARGLPARSPSAPRASLGASARSPARPRRPRDGLQSVGVPVCCLARPRRRPPAPRPSPAAAAWPRRHRVSKPALSLLINFACNSPSLSCRFVSVCSVMSLVFLNCMRLIFRTGPAAIRRYRERANLSLSDLPIDQTGCVRG